MLIFDLSSYFCVLFLYCCLRKHPHQLRHTHVCVYLNMVLLSQQSQSCCSILRGDSLLSAPPPHPHVMTRVINWREGNTRWLLECRLEFVHYFSGANKTNRPVLLINTNKSRWTLNWFMWGWSMFEGSDDQLSWVGAPESQPERAHTSHVAAERRKVEVEEKQTNDCGAKRKCQTSAELDGRFDAGVAL